MRTALRFTNMFEKVEYKKTIFQGLISQVLFDTETSDEMFCTAIGYLTICIPIGAIGLLYLFYNNG